MASNEKPIFKRHDRVFRASLQKVKEALAFLQGVLPKAQQAHILWHTLRRDNESYITEELKEYMSDLVYWAEWSNHAQGRVTFLFEHKSEDPAFPIQLQIETYLNKIRLKSYQPGKPLPLVVPILFYHGSTSLEIAPYASLFDPDIPGVFEKYLPKDQEILLVDLTKYEDEELLAMFPRDTVGRMCVLMKHIHDPDLPDHAHEYLGDLGPWEEDPERRVFIRTFLLYLKSEYQKRKIPMERLTQTVQQAGLDYEDPMEIFALDYVERGLKKGRAEGKAEGKAEGRTEGAHITLALMKGQAPQKIATELKVSLEQVLEIKKELGL